MVDKGIKKKFTSKAPPSNSATSIGGNPTTATAFSQLIWFSL